MASAQVHVEVCDLCGSSKRVAWQCLQCEEVLCEGCKNIHLKGKATREHEIQYSGKPVHDAYKMASFTVKTDQTFNGAIASVTPVTKKTAWIGMEREKTLNLHDSDGKILKDISFDHFISSVAVADNGNVYVTIPLKGQVAEISPTFEKSNIAYFEHLQPRGICLTKSGHIIVTVVEFYDTKKTKESARLVYKINMKGMVLEIFGYEKPDKSMFTIPRRVKENINRDLIVIDKTADKAASVVCLDQSGAFRFRYQPSTTFHASDITIDPNGGRIIITEQTLKEIQVIDQNGQFIQHIKTDFNTGEVPRSINFGIDRLLWIGYEKGKVATFEYLL